MDDHEGAPGRVTLRFDRQEVEDAVWLAFAHASATRDEVVRVARRRGTRPELVELLGGLAPAEFADATDVWRAVEAAQAPSASSRPAPPG